MTSFVQCLIKKCNVLVYYSTGSSNLFAHSAHEPKYTRTFLKPIFFNAKNAFAALYAPWQYVTTSESFGILYKTKRSLPFFRVPSSATLRFQSTLIAVGMWPFLAALRIVPSYSS